MATQPGSRRALRDLLPATLATGAAALVVTLLVGGATEGIHSAFVPGTAELPVYAADVAAIPGAAGTGSNAGVTVRVRPSRPAPLGVVSVLDLVRPAVDDLAAETTSAVRGMLFDRGGADAAAPTADAAAPTAEATDVASAPAVVAPSEPVADGVVAASAAPAKRRGPKSRFGGFEPTLALASTEPAGLAANAAEDDRDRGRAHEAPPAHAPAHGYRTR